MILGLAEQVAQRGGRHGHADTRCLSSDDMGCFIHDLPDTRSEGHRREDGNESDQKVRQGQRK